MTKPLLDVSGMTVVVAGKAVTSSVDMEIAPGEIHMIMGENGSGKSSLTQALMGNLEYKVSDITAAKILFEGKDLLAMSSDERAKSGLYIAWQSPVSIPGVSVFSLCKAGHEARGSKIAKLTEFKKHLEDLALQVGLTPDYISREVNVGFSGGERKRLELLQLLLFKPKLAILDEIDSGLDFTGVRMFKVIVDEMRKKGTSFIIITHNKKTLDDLAVDKTWEMKRGKLSTGV